MDKINSERLGRQSQCFLTNSDSKADVLLEAVVHGKKMRCEGMHSKEKQKQELWSYFKDMLRSLQHDERKGKQLTGGSHSVRS